MTAIRTQALRRGGQVTIVSAAGEQTITLAKRRFALVAALLAPPAPYRAGDFVPDYILVPLVWTQDEVVGRENINVLLHRVRHDLAAAGVATGALIERAPGGRATRLNLEVLAPAVQAA
jgi:hypothetical protein